MTKEDRINELRAQFLEYEQEWQTLQEQKKETTEHLAFYENEVIEKNTELSSLNEKYNLLKIFPSLESDAKEDSKKNFCFFMIVSTLISLFWGFLSGFQDILITFMLFVSLTGLSFLSSVGMYRGRIMPIIKSINAYELNDIEKVENFLDQIHETERSIDSARISIESKEETLARIEEKEQILMDKICKLYEDLLSLTCPMEFDVNFLRKEEKTDEKFISRVREKLIQGVE